MVDEPGAGRAYEAYEAYEAYVSVTEGHMTLHAIVLRLQAVLDVRDSEHHAERTRRDLIERLQLDLEIAQRRERERDAANRVTGA